VEDRHCFVVATSGIFRIVVIEGVETRLVKGKVSMRFSAASLIHALPLTPKSKSMDHVASFRYYLNRLVGKLLHNC